MSHVTHILHTYKHCTRTKESYIQLKEPLFDQKRPLFDENVSLNPRSTRNLNPHLAIDSRDILRSSIPFISKGPYIQSKEPYIQIKEIVSIHTRSTRKLPI